MDDFETLAEAYVANFSKELNAVENMCTRIGYAEGTESEPSADHQVRENWMDLSNFGRSKIEDRFSSIHRYLSAFNPSG